MEDNYKYKGLRKILTSNLLKKALIILMFLMQLIVFQDIFFLEKALDEYAYIDKGFPVGFNQTISQPYTVAYQTSILDIKKLDKVVEI